MQNYIKEQLTRITIEKQFCSRKRGQFIGQSKKSIAKIILYSIRVEVSTSPLQTQERISGLLSPNTTAIDSYSAPPDERATYRVDQLKVMDLRQERQHKLLVVLWIAVNSFFWLWW